MGKKVPFIEFFTISILALLSPVVIAVDTGEKPERQEFNLSEISVFEIDDQVHTKFTRGQMAACKEQCDSEVKAYPDFTSDRPLYGSVRFAGDYTKGDPGIEYHFAVEESKGTGTGFDLLYFDLNCDLDLTNDMAVKSLSDPPQGALMNYSSIKQQVCFNYLSVDFDFGSDGQRPMEIMPRLIISDGGYASVGFVTTKAFKGEIEITKRKYNLFLGHNYQIAGWFDHPMTALHLIPKSNEYRQAGWLGTQRLKAMHKINGTYYSFSATPSGDRLYVEPYKGEFGLLKIGSGWRIIFDKGFYGSLLSTKAFLAVGKESNHGLLKPSAGCELPVGDYSPAHLTIEYKPFRFDISENYYSDGKLNITSDRPPKHSIRIRKNRPFILNFSNKAEVMFASPAKDHSIKPGDTLVVNAVLIDPELDVMIRNLQRRPYPNIFSLSSVTIVIPLMIPGLLWILFRRVRKRYRFLLIISVLGLLIFVGYTIAMYSVNYRLNYDKLEPRVLVTRANGEKVAEGVMPFG